VASNALDAAFTGKRRQDRWHLCLHEVSTTLFPSLLCDRTKIIMNVKKIFRLWVTF
jgi:hypothetical protein